MSHHSIARLHRHSPPLRSPIEQGQSPSSPAPAAAIPPSLPHETSDAASVHPLERAPAMSRRRPRGGAQRMDAAIDHFAPMGYRRADVRSVVNKLLKDVYGKDGWPFLEDSCYYVVQEALLEMQEQQDKLQLQAVQQQQQHEDGDGDGGDDDDDEEAQQQEAAMIEPPLENAMPIVMVHSEAPSETLLTVEQTGEVIPMIMDPPAPRTALPHPASTGTGRTRRPCYGWISESESDSDYEEYLARRQKQVHVPAK